MALLAFAGTGRSGTALRLAAVGSLLFGLLVLLFSLRLQGGRIQDQLLVVFAVDALLFHVGLVVAVVARLGDPTKRGAHSGLAIIVNLLPAALFWLMVYALMQALKSFT